MTIKKEETNDILQYLIPMLERLGISKNKCKVDVTTEKSGQKEGMFGFQLKTKHLLILSGT